MSSATVPSAIDLVRTTIPSLTHSQISGRPRVFASTIAVFLLRVAGAVLSFATAVLLVRCLGKDGYGVYAWAFAMVSLIAVPIQQALPVLVARETARADVAREWGAMRGLWRWATVVSLATSAVMALCVLGIAWFFVDALCFWTLAYASALVPLLALGNLRAAGLRGLRHVVAGQLPELIVRPAGFLALIVLVSATAAMTRWTPDAAMATHLAAAGIAFGTGAMLLDRLSPPEMRAARRSDCRSREWLAAMIPLSLTGLLQAVNQHINVLALGSLATDADVGVYAAVSTLTTLIVFGLQVTALSVGPEFARLHVQRNKVALQKLAIATSRMSLVLALPVAAVMCFFGDFLLTSIYGPDFVIGHTSLTILAGSQLVNAAAGSVGLLLLMTGNERYVASSLAVAVGINVAVTLVTIPVFGLAGAALAAAASLITWNVLMRRAVQRILGIETFALFSGAPRFA